MEKITKILEIIKKRGLYPDVHTINSPHASEVLVDDRKVLLFASNNYLDLMTDSRVKEAAIKGVEKWGIGSGSARLLTGNLHIHEDLEKLVAEFKKKEASLTFISGYSVNLGAIKALVSIPDFGILSKISNFIDDKDKAVVFSDENNHASIIAGIKLSGAKKEIYKHADMGDLLSKIKKYSKKQRKIIITDSVFSMDGSFAPLVDIVEIAKKYKALIYLDDAHGTGIFGENGRGLAEYYGVEDDIDITMGTFTKSFGGVGGFISGSRILVDYLKISVGTFIFTAPIAPPVVCGLLESIEIVKKEPWRREKVIKNSEYLRKKLDILKVNYLESKSQIIPLLIGDEKKASNVSQYFLENFIFVPAARWPAVSKGSARIRITVSCNHSFEEIDRLVEVVEQAKKEFNF